MRQRQKKTKTKFHVHKISNSVVSPYTTSESHLTRLLGEGLKQLVVPNGKASETIGRNRGVCVREFEKCFPPSVSYVAV